MKKLKERLIRYALIVMIGLSFFLSWKIWTQSGNKSLQNMNTSATPLAVKEAKDIFVPVQLVYHESPDNAALSNRSGLIDRMNRLLFQLKLGRVTAHRDLSDDRYFALQQVAPSVELIFSDAISLEYYLDINEEKLKGDAIDNVTVNRLVFDPEASVLYFMDDRNKTIYEASASGLNEETYQDLLSEGRNHFKKVTMDGTLTPHLYLYDEPVTLKKYSYILETQSYTMFSNALFKNTEDVFANDAQKDDKNINLMNAEGQKLNIQYETGEVRFNDRYSPANPNALEMANTSYQAIKRIANNMGIVRYFANQNGTIVYRNFVEGYPIFSDQNKGRIEVSFFEGLLSIVTNQETILVPIPADETVTLPQTSDVLNELLMAGVKKEDIQGLQIGYTWHTNRETRQVVDLEPEWYVNYRGVWNNVPTVLHLLATEREEM